MLLKYSYDLASLVATLQYPFNIHPARRLILVVLGNVLLTVVHLRLSHGEGVASIAYSGTSPYEESHCSESRTIKAFHKFRGR
jgi:hypothetical protein